MTTGAFPEHHFEVALDADDIEIGDVVIGRTEKDWEIFDPVSFKGWKKVTDELFEVVDSHDNWRVRAKDFSGTGRFRVVRARADRCAAPPSSNSSTHWNGKCRACGRNTYTGFLRIEHEGGRCG